MSDCLERASNAQPPKPASDWFQQVESMLLAMNASLGHCHTCDDAADDATKADFRQSFGHALRALVAHSTKAVSEEEHISNIEQLADRISAARSAVLDKGRCRTGSAQKTLNLYLKYLWCAGYISEPTHCPFDRIVLPKLPCYKEPAPLEAALQVFKMPGTT